MLHTESATLLLLDANHVNWRCACSAQIMPGQSGTPHQHDPYAQRPPPTSYSAPPSQTPVQPGFLAPPPSVHQLVSGVAPPSHFPQQGQSQGFPPQQQVGQPPHQASLARHSLCLCFFLPKNVKLRVVASNFEPGQVFFLHKVWWITPVALDVSVYLYLYTTNLFYTRYSTH